MGMGVIGGLIVGTALTLYVIPAFYVMLASGKSGVAAQPEAGAPPETRPGLQG